ncbi:MAG TPA: HAD-IA family hydrolase [Gemmatimonadales bacterium]|nr:HAD-IA family hydrolase [Gemmatimonadales bacterium]
MLPIATVLFDLDGTLIDSIRLIIDSYHHTLEVHGIPPRTDREWLDGIGTPLRVQFGEWAHDEARMEAMIATYRDYNIFHHDSRVTVYPGVVEMIAAVRGRGCRTGIVTSKNRVGAFRGLRLAGLEAAMDVVIGADDVTHPKPHREPIDRAVELLGANAASTIYVGDSVHDMHAGRHAGVRTAAVLWGPFGRADLEGAAPDHWLEHPSELLTLFEASR